MLQRYISPVRQGPTPRSRTHRRGIPAAAEKAFLSCEDTQITMLFLCNMHKERKERYELGSRSRRGNSIQR